jgi:asparagine synthase (glutamine-hydrolysing)
MCGFVGAAATTPLPCPDAVAAGAALLSHRGPDDSGVWHSPDGRVALGHRRLAILDLTAAGHQPMHDEAGALTIVFNGEIYNFAELRRELEAAGHAFRSGTDTEVILAAYRQWGTECVGRLAGMFAFSLFDGERRRLFLARDRAGEKPLFVHRSTGVLRFASELKALLADPALSRRIDPVALDCYLAVGYVPGDRCMLQGFGKVPPAHALTFDLDTGAERAWRYWAPPTPADGDGRRGGAGGADEADEELLDELEALLEDSVRRQLVADVPVGVLLSGGVDSSLVTAMAVRADPRIRTFTISFPGQAAEDETEHARLIARHFGTEHMELAAGPATAELVPALARQFDEPVADSSMIPTFLVSRLVREHCTVALGGDGGDELFGGYPHYSRLLWLRAGPGRLPGAVRRAVARGAEGVLPPGFRGRNYFQALGADPEHGVPLIMAHFDPGTRRRLMADHGPWATEGEGVLRERMARDGDFLARATRLDFENYLPEDLLVKVDRASMMTSLEVRAPLLDHRIIEFAFGKVPSRLKATAREKKILLKRLTARVLPAGFDRNRKQGFSIPMARWLAGGPFRELFYDVLRDPGCLFERRAVDALLQGQDRGRNNGERLFALVLFELWRREYGVAL